MCGIGAFTWKFAVLRPVRYETATKLYPVIGLAFVLKYIMINTYLGI